MKVDVTFVLDISGSMSDYWNKVVKGYNHFLKAQREAEGRCVFSLVLFGENVYTPIEGEDIEIAPDMIAEEYYDEHRKTGRCNRRLEGGTAYRDGVAEAIKKAQQRQANAKHKADKVIIITLSDGGDNESNIMLTQLTSKIENQRAEGWEFMFIGIGYMDANDYYKATRGYADGSHIFVHVNRSSKDDVNVIYETLDETLTVMREGEATAADLAGIYNKHKKEG